MGNDNTKIDADKMPDYFVLVPDVTEVLCANLERSLRTIVGRASVSKNERLPFTGFHLMFFQRMEELEDYETSLNTYLHCDSETTAIFLIKMLRVVVQTPRNIFSSRTASYRRLDSRSKKHIKAFAEDYHPIKLEIWGKVGEALFFCIERRDDMYTRWVFEAWRTAYSIFLRHVIPAIIRFRRRKQRHSIFKEIEEYDLSSDGGGTSEGSYGSDVSSSEYDSSKMNLCRRRSSDLSISSWMEYIFEESGSDDPLSSPRRDFSPTPLLNQVHKGNFLKRRQSGLNTIGEKIEGETPDSIRRSNPKNEWHMGKKRLKTRVDTYLVDVYEITEHKVTSEDVQLKDGRLRRRSNSLRFSALGEKKGIKGKRPKPLVIPASEPTMRLSSRISPHRSPIRAGRSHKKWTRVSKFHHSQSPPQRRTPRSFVTKSKRSSHRDFNEHSFSPRPDHSISPRKDQSVSSSPRSDQSFSPPQEHSLSPRREHSVTPHLAYISLKMSSSRESSPEKEEASPRHFPSPRCLPPPWRLPSPRLPSPLARVTHSNAHIGGDTPAKPPLSRALSPKEQLVRKRPRRNSAPSLLATSVRWSYSGKR